jgi:hypothetical protein
VSDTVTLDKPLTAHSVTLDDESLGFLYQLLESAPIRGIKSIKVANKILEALPALPKPGE